MATPPNPSRSLPIDHLRGFIFLLMAIDHSLHAYASHWGRFWFFRDTDRSVVFDVLYLFNQSLIMPALFFSFGFYVLQKYKTLGLKKFWQDRLIKFGIPFAIGIPLIVPLLSYPKFYAYTDSSVNYWDFWTSLFFQDRLQAGPFWVMYALLLYTALLLLITRFMPPILSWITGYVKALPTHPIKVLTGFILFAAVVYGLSDLVWGAPWWIGFGKLFYFQGSRFLMNFVFFTVGAAFAQSGLMQGNLGSLEKKRFFFLALTGGVGALYCAYSLILRDAGAYSDAVHHALLQNENWSYIFSLLCSNAPGVLIRTTLLAALGTLQLLTLLLFMHAYANRPLPFWSPLAQRCWGLFIFHESVVVWMQFALLHQDWPIALKVTLTTMVGISTAWALTAFLQRFKPLNRILELD